MCFVNLDPQRSDCRDDDSVKVSLGLHSTLALPDRLSRRPLSTPTGHLPGTFIVFARKHGLRCHGFQIITQNYGANLFG